MYAGRVVCTLQRLVITVSMPSGHTDRRTDAGPLRYDSVIDKAANVIYECKINH